MTKHLILFFSCLTTLTVSADTTGNQWFGKGKRHISFEKIPDHCIAEGHTYFLEGDISFFRNKQTKKYRYTLKPPEHDPICLYIKSEYGLFTKAKAPNMVIVTGINTVVPKEDFKTLHTNVILKGKITYQATSEYSFPEIQVTSWRKANESN